MSPPLTTPGPAAPPVETVLLDLKPHPAFIVLRSQAVLLTIVALGAGALWLAGRFGTGGVAGIVIWLAPGLVLVVLAWNLLVWLSRAYRLTSRRLIRSAGVLNRSTMEIPLERIQHLEVHRTWAERLLGLGSLGFSTAGGAWREMVWINIDRPYNRLDEIRAAAERHSMMGPNSRTPPETRSAAVDPKTVTSAAGAQHRLPVIGLAGGIGSGKSEVGKLLGELGCFVIDSDIQARQALDRPEIRDALVRWWGRAILKPTGEVDRSQVARIVFGHDDQRRRLENLVHPLVRARRADLIREAAAKGARAAIVDAPLLFEAGVDRECDAVIFVEAPRDVRLRRVRQSRGWSEAELERRERAQLPIEEKRRRSTHIIVNTGGRDELRREVARVLSVIEAAV